MFFDVVGKNDIFEKIKKSGECSYTNWLEKKLKDLNNGKLQI